MSGTKSRSALNQPSWFQVSPVPYATASLLVPLVGSSSLNVPFPGVTTFVTIQNKTSGTNVPLRVGFSDNGVQAVETANYFVLNNGESWESNWQITNLFLNSEGSKRASANVIAGVTQIWSGSIANNWSGSLGVG